MAESIAHLIQQNVVLELELRRVMDAMLDAQVDARVAEAIGSDAHAHAARSDPDGGAVRVARVDDGGAHGFNAYTDERLERLENTLGVERTKRLQALARADAEVKQKEDALEMAAAASTKAQASYAAVKRLRSELAKSEEQLGSAAAEIIAMRAERGELELRARSERKTSATATRLYEKNRELEGLLSQQVQAVSNSAVREAQAVAKATHAVRLMCMHRVT